MFISRIQFATDVFFHIFYLTEPFSIIIFSQLKLHNPAILPYVLQLYSYFCIVQNIKLPFITLQKTDFRINFTISALSHIFYIYSKHGPNLCLGSIKIFRSSGKIISFFSVTPQNFGFRFQENKFSSTPSDIKISNFNS